MPVSGFTHVYAHYTCSYAATSHERKHAHMYTLSFTQHTNPTHSSTTYAPIRIPYLGSTSTCTHIYNTRKHIHTLRRNTLNHTNAYIYIYGCTKVVQKFYAPPDFRFVAQLTHLYGPHLHRNYERKLN